VSRVFARTRACSIWCTRLVPAACCLFSKHTTAVAALVSSDATKRGDVIRYQLRLAATVRWRTPGGRRRCREVRRQ
jgi:hypothetical protein